VLRISRKEKKIEEIFFLLALCDKYGVRESEKKESTMRWKKWRRREKDLFLLLLSFYGCLVDFMLSISSILFFKMKVTKRTSFGD
jgi:hypothetical protein